MHYLWKSTTANIIAGVLILLLGTIRFANAGEPPVYSLEEMQDMVVARVVVETKADVDDIQVVEAEARSWLDGSLGCPGRRRLIGRSQVPGYRFLIKLGETYVEYHTDDEGTIIRCADPAKPIDRIAR